MWMNYLIHRLRIAARRKSAPPLEEGFCTDKVLTKAKSFQIWRMLWRRLIFICIIVSTGVTGAQVLIERIHALFMCKLNTNFWGSRLEKCRFLQFKFTIHAPVAIFVWINCRNSLQVLYKGKWVFINVQYIAYILWIWRIVQICTSIEEFQSNKKKKTFRQR